MDSDVEEIARFLRQGQLRSGMEHDQRPAASAEFRRGVVLASRHEPERVVPDGQSRRDVGHLEMNRPETGGLRQQSFVHRHLSDCGR